MNDNLRNSWVLILRRLRDPRILAVFLFLYLFALLVYQYFVDPYRSFLSGLEGTRINNTSRVRLAIDRLEREKSFVLQRKYLLAWNAVQEGRFQDALRLADESKTHPDVEVEARVVAGQAAYRGLELSHAFVEALRSYLGVGERYDCSPGYIEGVV